MQHLPTSRRRFSLLRSVLISISSSSTLLVALALLLPPLAGAFDEPDRSPAMAAKVYRNPNLHIANVFRTPAELPSRDAERAQQALSALGVTAQGARVDVRSGRFGTLIPTHPLIPGTGLGNGLTWAGMGADPPRNGAALRRAASKALRDYLRTRNPHLQIDVDELADPSDVEVSAGGDLVQIHAARVVDGLPVRNSYVTAVVNRGNLVLLGTHNWGDVEVSTNPSVSLGAARAAIAAHLEATSSTSDWGKAELLIVPMAQGSDLDQIPVGLGYDYRLAWLVRPQIPGEVGRWEGLVDAHSGELLAFEDSNHYAATARRVVGGVYPISNDGVFPDGQEQPGWPMPFTDVQHSGDTLFTDSGGNLLRCIDGTISTQLDGPFVRINDNCGVINESSSIDIFLGAGGGTDCTTTPISSSAGNTHSARTGFYELNRIIEMGRGHLPGNIWLRSELLANMNINATCNAFWNGTVNFFKSGGGCANTGEIAGIFDHEWGHGMDANGVHAGVSSPGEGIADIYAALRLNESCIGRNFRPGVQCSGFGDPCTQCTGVRDIDWAKRQSGVPHDVAWINANCGSGAGTPCGGSTHCEGAIYAEAVWDLLTRDLPGAPFNMDANTAREIVTRLTFAGAGSVGSWFQCNSGGNGGCNGDGGYLNYLAADDDDGNLNNGTPHMSAIFDAFNRHGIACNTPSVQNSGCSGAPNSAPAVAAAALDRGASLSWNAVAGAQKYQVFRSDGVAACDFGKIKVGETTDTSFVDSGLQNGRNYDYVVAPIGTSDACIGPVSSCTSVTPTTGSNLVIDANSVVVNPLSGDGDPFLDNCESGDVSFDIINLGGITQTNVRIVDFEVVSHPGGVTVTSSLPKGVTGSLSPCAAATGSIAVTAEPQGLAFNDTVELRVDVTSDQLDPRVASQTLYINLVESDFDSSPSTTFTFESDFEDWQVVEGIFERTSAGGGALGTSFYVASSASLADQCDHIRSPLIRFSANSTLTIWNQFDIEGFDNPTGQWYDRANVGIYDPATGIRTPIDPDGGRMYNGSGPGGTCGTAGQNGWVDAMTSWAASAWSSSALGTGSIAGEFVQLDIRYGTDPLEHGFGFHFDQVTLTNAEIQVPDTQSDTCDPPPVCGNSVAEASEVCDGADLRGQSCADFSCAGGTLTCEPTCNAFDLSGCTGCPTCGNGTCDLGEDCSTCATDCPGGSNAGALCGNGVCEAGDGENCVNCSADCAGRQSGRPTNRFCCGDGAGTNPIVCGDSRCSTGGFSCTDVPAPAGDYCCGDGVCEDPEDGLSCELDCGTPLVCGDGVCSMPAEDVCSCSADCGAPPTEICNNGIDDDCDLFVDCSDPDCSGDPSCPSCGPVGASCTSDGECCSNKCRGKPGAKTCK